MEREEFINKVDPSKKFFEGAEAFCWYNEAFLASLMGYDGLKIDDKNSIIVNFKILNVLKR